MAPRRGAWLLALGLAAYQGFAFLAPTVPSRAPTGLARGFGRCPQQRAASATQRQLVPGAGEALATILVSEMGDKTFFLTMVLAMRKSRRLDVSRNDRPALPLAWVHFPKCGSSFLNMLIHQPDFCDVAPGFSVDEDNFGTCFSFNFNDVCEDLCDTQRLRCQPVVHECIGSQYTELKGHMVGMFRQPEQRILSAYHDEQHNWLVEGDCEEKAAPKPALPIFAELFGGTVTYQLTGEGYAGDHKLPLLPDLPVRTRAMAEEAVRRVSGFAFVGITDEWDLSVCLFHATFGTKCRALDFLDVRPGTSEAEVYDTAPLRGYRDELDGMVYQEALRIFQANLLKYNVSMDSCQRCFNEAQGV
ncbi:unnamed protein product [Effrenium voratum]|uniref:GDT1 family protein n=1 Tax=Effrenium voratum TaxID=2562239 RepID=A0AA36ML32_9DINO|nr:unnamed protein product [Effrenium voratum]